MERQVTVVNQRGLHARAAAKLVTLTERFSASLEVCYDGQCVAAASIMGLMMLGAGPGAVVSVRGTGADATDAIDALVSLIEAGFHEAD